MAECQLHLLLNTVNKVFILVIYVIEPNKSAIFIRANEKETKIVEAINFSNLEMRFTLLYFQKI
jgi:hypothetical protein